MNVPKTFVANGRIIKDMVTPKFRLLLNILWNRGYNVLGAILPTLGVREAEKIGGTLYVERYVGMGSIPNDKWRKEVVHRYVKKFTEYMSKEGHYVLIYTPSKYGRVSAFILIKCSKDVYERLSKLEYVFSRGC